MKQLAIPYIKGLEALDFESLDKQMEEKASKAAIDTVDWPAEFPYKPQAAFAIARTDSHLVIEYNVSGLDLRAKALEDNGPVWEDSCCEFFIADPSDGTYYNFELNCIGTLLAAKRKSRTDCRHFEADMMAHIIRHSSLEKKEYEINGETFCWKTALCIPMEMVGINPCKLPGYIRANVYKCADKAAHPHYLSWNRVETQTPDFHRPEFFGKMSF